MCQSVLRAIPAGEGAQQLSIEERFTIQEAFCNSLGLALSFQNRGFIYKDYKALVEPAFGTHPNGRQISFILLSETEYNQLPKFGAIIE